MEGVAGGRARINLQLSGSVPLATDRGTLVRAAAAFSIAAAFLALLLLALHHFFTPEGAHHPAGWMLTLRSLFVLPPLVLFTAVTAGVAFVPRRMRVGAMATTFGLTLWMAYELAAVLFAGPDTRGLTVELGIDFLVVAGITSYLYGGLLEHYSLTSRAEHDPLTGLFNRDGANRAWDALAPGTRVTLAIVDLNELKVLNDRHGHGAGDDLLLACAAELRQIRGSTGLAVRWGGDEFLLALPEHSPEEARVQLEQAAARITIGFGELPVWAVGTAGAAAGPTLHEAMKPADADMYRHKAEQYLNADLLRDGGAISGGSTRRSVPPRPERGS